MIRSEFSPHTRGYNLARLRAELFDILVIGGGLTGAAVAREAAQRGFKVALVEKDDFGGGAPWQLLAGGARHMDGFQLRGGLNASRERERLVRATAGRAWPLTMNYPVYRDTRISRDVIELGLEFYRALAFFPPAERHTALGTRGLASQFPGMDLSGVASAIQFREALLDKAGLTLDTLRSAHRLGAVIVNHAQVIELLRSTGKRLDGIGAHDRISDEYLQARARVIVNATGPWLDTIARMDNPGVPDAVCNNKLVYLLVPHDRFPVEQGLAFRVREDGNWMFVLPHGPYVLIGPLEVEHKGSPDQVSLVPAELDYILRAINLEFPGYRMRKSDVMSAFVSLRPLITNGRSLGVGPRHWPSRDGLQNILNGESALHAIVAGQFGDKAVRLLDVYGVRPTPPGVTPAAPAFDSGAASDAVLRGRAEALDSLPLGTRLYLERTYGPRLFLVLDYIRADHKLRASIVDGYPFVWAEVRYAVEHEMAVTVADVMVRRLGILHQVPDGAVGAASEVARYMARLLDWLDPDIDRQVEAYVQAVEHNLEPFLRATR